MDTCKGIYMYSCMHASMHAETSACASACKYWWRVVNTYDEGLLHAITSLLRQFKAPKMQEEGIIYIFSSLQQKRMHLFAKAPKYTPYKHNYYLHYSLFPSCYSSSSSSSYRAPAAVTPTAAAAAAAPTTTTTAAAAAAAGAATGGYLESSWS